MDRERFLAQLERKLLWHFSGARTREVVADYRDYFEQGKADGRTEQELCEACGMPGEIVRSLLEEERGKCIPPMAVFCLWCAAVLCFALPVRRAYVLGTLLSAMLTGMAVQWLSAAAGGEAAWGVPPQECGPKLSLLLTAARLMAAFFWIAGEARLRGTRVQWPLSFLLAGIIEASVGLDLLLHRLDTPAGFLSGALPTVLLPLAVGLVLCIAAAIDRKRVDAWTAR